MFELYGRHNWNSNKNSVTSQDKSVLFSDRGLFEHLQYSRWFVKERKIYTVATKKREICFPVPQKSLSLGHFHINKLNYE